MMILSREKKKINLQREMNSLFDNLVWEIFRESSNGNTETYSQNLPSSICFDARKKCLSLSKIKCDKEICVIKHVNEINTWNIDWLDAAGIWRPYRRSTAKRIMENYDVSREENQRPGRAGECCNEWWNTVMKRNPVKNHEKISESCWKVQTQK